MILRGRLWCVYAFNITGTQVFRNHSPYLLQLFMKSTWLSRFAYVIVAEYFNFPSRSVDIKSRRKSQAKQAPSLWGSAVRHEAAAAAAGALMDGVRCQWLEARGEKQLLSSRAKPMFGKREREGALQLVSTAEREKSCFPFGEKARSRFSLRRPLLSRYSLIFFFPLLFVYRHLVARGFSKEREIFRGTELY